jgi:hypothetical protein
MKKWIYFQIMLQDETPKRIVSLTNINKNKAAELLGIDKDEILCFEKIKEENIKMVPKVENGKIKYKKERLKT